MLKGNYDTEIDEDLAFEDYFELVEQAQEPKNHDVVFITTAEYEGLRNRIAELEEALKNEKNSLKVKEWILYNGEGCPIDEDCRIDVKFRDNSTAKDYRAGYWIWNNTGEADDIIAYRIVK